MLTGASFDERGKVYVELGKSGTRTIESRIHALLLQDVVLPHQQLHHSRLVQVQLRTSLARLQEAALPILLLP